MPTYKYRPLKRPTNFRLITLHPGEIDETISIGLCETIFDKKDLPRYEALFYVWGTEKAPKTVYINDEKTGAEGLKRFHGLSALGFGKKGRKLSVTQNLMVALKHLRSPESSRTLWIDALSIDQSNNVEKGTQVAMMGEIFRLALRVIAWLGPEENGSDKAMGIMGWIGLQIEVDWDTNLITPAPSSSHPNLADSTADVDLKVNEVKAIHQLISRPWYDRLWIRQEIYLANEHAVVQCGAHGIFLLNEGDKLACPPPDYKLPLVRVYQEVVLGYLGIFETLNILRSCELHANSPSPSWVPDLEIEATGCLNGRPLLASSRLGAWYELPRNGVLRVAGGDTITLVSEVRDITIGDTRLISIRDYLHKLLAGQDLFAKYVNGDSMIEAYARTFVCDGVRDRMDPASYAWPDLESAKNIVTRIQSETQFSDFEYAVGTPCSELLSTFVENRDKKFINCGEGYIGIAPPATLPGDQVCTLLGCNSPMVLRPSINGGYIVVGECFVNGLSKGESLLGPLPKDVRVAIVFDQAAGVNMYAFVNGFTNVVSFMDPRIAALGLTSEELEEYKQDLSENARSVLKMSPQRLQSLRGGYQVF